MTPSEIASISKETAEHYVWGSGCDGWHLVKNAGLSVIQERMPPGTSETRHFHRQAQQFFYVLSGTAVIEVEGERFALTAGTGVRVSTGIPHQIKNESGEDVHFLVISQPPSHGDRHAADASS
jgi:mannose-6-phosphate isomerase-like protein (cupin superfamily)